MKLNFNKAIINSTLTTRLRFCNNGIVGTSMSWQLSYGNNGIFTIDPFNINIDPYCTGYFTISFKPVAIESYETNLEITYDVPPQQQRKQLKIKIIGEGYVPEVILIEPKLDAYLNSYNFTFNPVLIKDCDCKTITFQNVGILTCKVIIEIRGDKEEAFSLLPHDDSVKYLNMLKNCGKIKSFINRPHYEDVTLFLLFYL